MPKIISFSFDGSDTRAVAALRVTNERLTVMLLEKMTFLMTRLQEKIRGKIHSVSGKLSSSIDNPRAEVEGTNIVGKLDVGKTAISEDGFNYTMAVEKGIEKEYEIHPLAVEGTRMYLNPKGLWRRGHHKGAIRRFGQGNLQLFSQKLGKEVFASYVTHGPVEGKYFIKSSLEEMQEEFRQGIIETLESVNQS
jgi:hypothetical protein